MIRATPPTIVDLGDRDSYFELKVRERFEPVEFANSTFDPVDVLLLDPLAYRELRLEMLSSVQESVIDELDEYSRRRLDEVLEAIPKGGVVPVFGAGMSTPSGYPGWTAFLRVTAKGWLEDETVDELVDSGDFEGLATRIRAAIGPISFEERMSIFGLASRPSEALYLAVELFSQGHFVTTNFDTLIEEACRDLGIELRAVHGCATWSGWSSEIYDGDPHVLLKLHGHFRRPTARVLLKDEYDIAYAKAGPVRRDLETLLLHRSLVFLGASLSADRTMALAAELIAETSPGSTPRHHAFLPLGTRTLQREAFLGDRNVFAIWYPSEDGDHTALGDILWWAREVVRA